MTDRNEDLRPIYCKFCDRQTIHRWFFPRLAGRGRNSLGQPVSLYSGGGWICTEAHVDEVSR